MQSTRNAKGSPSVQNESTGTNPNPHEEMEKNREAKMVIRKNSIVAF